MFAVPLPARTSPPVHCVPVISVPDDTAEELTVSCELAVNVMPPAAVPPVEDV